MHIKLIDYSLIKESAFDLSIFSKDEIDLFKLSKSPKRKKELYFSRLLWKSFNIDQKIQYLNNGKPFISRGFISISHAANMVAIAFSKLQNVGVDLELKNPKLIKIQSRFIHESEKIFLKKEKLQQLTILWSIKEATFKFLGLENVFFKEMLLVKELETEKGRISVIHPKFSGEFNFEYFDLVEKECILTYIHT